MGREGRFEIKNLFAVPQRYLGFPTDPAIPTVRRHTDDTGFTDSAMGCWSQIGALLALSACLVLCHGEQSVGGAEKYDVCYYVHGIGNMRDLASTTTFPEYWYVPVTTASLPPFQ